MFPKRSTPKGFTLIELLIAVGLFSVIVSIATGGFVTALRTQRQVVGLTSANNNVSLAMEQMAREIRTGSGFSCAASCRELTFQNARGENVRYRFDTAEGYGQIKRSTEFLGGTAEPITARNVDVRSLAFSLIGADPIEKIQPRITIFLSISPREGNVSGNVVNLQTTVSSRAKKI